MFKSIDWSDVVTGPNIVTALRIWLTVYVVHYILTGRYLEALILFLVAGATDWFDGRLARWLRLMSRFGVKFDPIADKVWLGGTLVALGLKGLVPPPYVILVIARDVSILVVGIILLWVTRVRDLPARWPGKVSTTGQFIAVTFWMIAKFWLLELYPGVVGFVAGAVLLASAVLTLWSWWDYGKVAIRLWAAHKISQGESIYR